MMVFVSVSAAISPTFLRRVPNNTTVMQNLAGRWNLHCTWANVKNIQTCWVNGDLNGIKELHDHLFKTYATENRELESDERAGVRIRAGDVSRQKAVDTSPVQPTSTCTTSEHKSSYIANQTPSSHPLLGSQSDTNKDGDVPDDDFGYIEHSDTVAQQTNQLTSNGNGENYLAVQSSGNTFDPSSYSLQPNADNVMPAPDSTQIKSEFQLCDADAGSIINMGTGYIPLTLEDMDRYRQKCDFCEAVFHLNKDYQCHIVSKHGNKDDIRICPICSLKLVDKAAVGNHIAAKHWRLKYMCNKCGKCFGTKRQLGKHSCVFKNEAGSVKICLDNDVEDPLELPWKSFIKHCTVRNGMLQCNYCASKVKGKKEFKMHISRKHMERSLQCPDCSNLFGNGLDLRYHIKTVHTRSKYTCTVCEKPFGTKARLTAHKQEHATEEMCVSCDKCGMTFSSVHLLVAHVKTDHQEETTEAGNPSDSTVLLTVDNLGLHSTVENGIFCCNYCDYRTEYRQTVINHLKRRHLEKTLPCPMCGVKYAVQNDLRRHIESKHLPKPAKDRIICHVCTQTFTTDLGFKFHMKRHEADPVEAQCDECGKMFYHASHLKAHKKRRHPKGPMPFVCAVCGKGFTHKCMYTEHVQTHAEKPGFQCSVCHKGFYREKCLKQHLKLHTDENRYLCPICGKQFISLPAQKIHVKRHSWKREHECQDCGKSFFTKNHLDRHKLTHTGERPYVCIVCCKAFSDVSTLKKHSQIHLR
ncbi:oocyte zinc finger protein XlCOF6 [Lingula anatina]|uniref:Oocyte zinc finger protein XlCOF6 n=1 Tax=Lingula anatina TaxID=7574 RepID=A0A1S3JUY1_LINAN|nr:oocyte zinc finger protein XlCOF6 [Lingula anatina]|eukprot:XP_013414133.1 oocyte zinc finger protein XlCOF6 [Lingula anatina]